jgi:hypothetical protein
MCVCVYVLVLLPASALQEIVSKDVAGKQFLSDSPLVFELSNPANGKKTYAGTQTFSSRCAVCGVRCAVCGVRCAVCGVRCAVCGVRCAVCVTLTFPNRCDGVSGR